MYIFEIQSVCTWERTFKRPFKEDLPTFWMRRFFAADSVYSDVRMTSIIVLVEPPIGFIEEIPVTRDRCRQKVPHPLRTNSLPILPRRRQTAFEAIQMFIGFLREQRPRKSSVVIERNEKLCLSLSQILGALPEHLTTLKESLYDGKRYQDGSILELKGTTNQKGTLEEDLARPYSEKLCARPGSPAWSDFARPEWPLKAIDIINDR